MAMKTRNIWNGGGYLYNGGDIPSCNYCGVFATEKAIYSSAHSGILLCDNESCILAYAHSNIMCEELIHETEEYLECDRCGEEAIAVNDEMHRINDEEDVCDYCIEDKEVL